MRVVYIDTLFAVNLIVNYLLLLTVCRICALVTGKARLVLAALTGAVYAVLTILPGFQFMQNPLLKIASGIVMLLCAFGGKKGLLKIGLIFLAVSAAFAGIVMAVALMGGDIWAGGGIYLPVDLKTLLLSIGLAYGVLTIVFKFMAAARGKGGYVGLEIAQDGRKISLLALKDTGNRLRDPVTGMPVPIIEYETAAELFESNIADVLKKTKDMPASERMELIWKTSPEPRFRLLPYSAVGVKSDMLLAFKPDGVRLGGKDMKGMWVALSPTRISDAGTYSALINGEY